MGLYKDNKKAKVGTLIECPVCHKKFKKIQYSQAFCCGHCKDKFHNRHDGDRHRSTKSKNEFEEDGIDFLYSQFDEYHDSWDDYKDGDNDQWEVMELGIHD